MQAGQRDWQAIESVEDECGTHCVDVFQRVDGSFGFEAFRRDPEDQGRWTMLGHYAAARFVSIEAARTAAAHAVPWRHGKFRRT